jgi:hypothetical protein
MTTLQQVEAERDGWQTACYLLSAQYQILASAVAKQSAGEPLKMMGYMQWATPPPTPVQTNAPPSMPVR